MSNNELEQAAVDLAAVLRVVLSGLISDAVKRPNDIDGLVDELAIRMAAMVLETTASCTVAGFASGFKVGNESITMAHH